MKHIVIKHPNRRLELRRVRRVKRKRGLITRPEYVTAADLHTWVLKRVDFAVRTPGGTDLTCSTLLDVMVHASESGTLHVAYEPLVQLIGVLYHTVPHDTPLDTTTLAPTQPLLVRFYPSSRRYWAPGFGYVTLDDLCGCVVRGRAILVVTEQSDGTIKRARVVNLKGGKERDVDITHHTLTVALRKLARRSAANVLGVRTLIELLRLPKREPQGPMVAGWSVWMEENGGDVTSGRKKRTTGRARVTEDVEPA